MVCVQESGLWMRPPGSATIIYQIKSPAVIIFTIDLRWYNERAPNGLSKLEESFLFFDTVVKSPWFYRQSVLLLGNFSSFTDQLQKTPLEKIKL